MDINLQQIQQMIEDALDARESKNAYGVSQTPFHTHNKTDSPTIDINANLPSQFGQAGNSLVTDGSKINWGVTTPTPPGGSDRQLQYDNGGIFGGTNIEFLGTGTLNTPTGDFELLGNSSGTPGNITIRSGGEVDMTAGNDGSVSFTDAGIQLTQGLSTVGGNVNIQIGLGTTKGVLNINGLPTSSVGLTSGDVWNSSGTLKIV